MKERYMALLNPNLFIHVANVLLLMAYSVRDILWLRLFAVGASVISIPYFILQPAPLWAPLAWSCIFASINLFQASRLIIERRPVKLTPEEENVRRLVFPDSPPRLVLQILSVGTWTDAQVGKHFFEHGKRIDAIYLIVCGRVQVTRNEAVLGELTTGSLIGSTLLLTGALSDVDVVATEPVRALRWEVGMLERYLTANPEARIVMQKHLARDLAGKLTSYANRTNSSQP